jgi:predicted negative regulator of RcsB-dependent stress response
MDTGDPAAVRVIARERLARVLLSQGDHQGALQLLDEAPAAHGFEAQFAEIRGDISRAQGDFEQAAKYYAEALDTLEAGTGNRGFLEIKLESVGGNLAAGGETT